MPCLPESECEKKKGGGKREDGGRGEGEGGGHRGVWMTGYFQMRQMTGD